MRGLLNNLKNREWANFSFRGLRPHDPHQALCPGPSLGLCLQTPIVLGRLRLLRPRWGAYAPPDPIAGFKRVYWVSLSRLMRLLMGCRLQSKSKDMYSSLQAKPAITATGTHIPYGTTQCYLPPSKGDITAFTLFY